MKLPCLHFYRNADVLHQQNTVDVQLSCPVAAFVYMSLCFYVCVFVFLFTLPEIGLLSFPAPSLSLELFHSIFFFFQNLTYVAQELVICLSFLCDLSTCAFQKHKFELTTHFKSLKRYRTTEKRCNLVQTQRQVGSKFSYQLFNDQGCELFTDFMMSECGCMQQTLPHDKQTNKQKQQ